MKQDTRLWDPFRASLTGPERVAAFEKFARRLADRRERLTGKPLPHSSQGFSLKAHHNNQQEKGSE